MYPMFSRLDIYIIIISFIVFKNVKFASAAPDIKLAIKWKIGQSICAQYREFSRTKKIHSRWDYYVNHLKPDYTGEKHKCRLEWHSCSSKSDSSRVCQKFVKKDCEETISKSRGMSMNSRSLGRSSERIANGGDADPKEYPYFVAFLKKGTMGTENRFPYGGTLINATHIVTSAKAGCAIKKHKMKALIMAYDRKEDEKTKEIIDVKKVYVYPFKNLTLPHQVNDIAVIELSRPACVVGDKPFLALPSPSRNDEASGTCIAIGWGSHRPVEDGAPIYEPKVLQKVQLKIISGEDCSKKFEGWNKMTDRHVCGYPDGKAQGICEGDLGGPLICKDKDGNPYLAGIASLNKSPCAEYEHASGFTRVSRFAKWIMGKIHC